MFGSVLILFIGQYKNISSIIIVLLFRNGSFFLNDDCVKKSKILLIKKNVITINLCNHFKFYYHYMAENSIIII